MNSSARKMKMQKVSGDFYLLYIKNRMKITEQPNMKTLNIIDGSISRITQSNLGNKYKKMSS